MSAEITETARAAALSVVRRKAVEAVRYDRDVLKKQTNFATLRPQAIFADEVGCSRRDLTGADQVLASDAWRTAYLSEWPDSEWPSP